MGEMAERARKALHLTQVLEDWYPVRVLSVRAHEHGIEVQVATAEDTETARVALNLGPVSEPYGRIGSALVQASGEWNGEPVAVFGRAS